MRTLHADLLTALRGEYPEVVHLVEIYTGYAATPILRYCSRPYDLAWNGNTWTGRDLEPGEVRVESQENRDGPTLELPDGDRVFRTLLAAGAPFVGSRCILRATVESLCLSGSGETTALRDDFLIDGYDLPEARVRIALKPFAALFDVMLPRTTLTRDLFPGIPRDATLL